MLLGASTKTCSKTGACWRASSPNALSSVGNARQPAKVRPCARQASAITSRACSARAASCDRNTLPAAKRCEPSTMLDACATRRRKRSGVFISNPQPSPVLPSAAMAPRWVMRSSAVIARCTRAWLDCPSICAIRPKPQLSRSNSGRYKPVGFTIYHHLISYRHDTTILAKPDPYRVISGFPGTHTTAISIIKTMCCCWLSRASTARHSPTNASFQRLQPAHSTLVTGSFEGGEIPRPTDSGAVAAWCALGEAATRAGMCRCTATIPL